VRLVLAWPKIPLPQQHPHPHPLVFLQRTTIVDTLKSVRNSPPQPDFGLDTVSDQGDSPDHHRWLTTDCDGPSIPSHVSHAMGAADIDRSTKIKFDLAKLVKIFAGRPTTCPVCLADKHG